jgi:hypothetical protein
MAGRAQQSFKKRQKEQQRKEKQQMKFAKRLQRKHDGPGEESPSDSAETGNPELNSELESPAVEDPARL